MNVKRKILFVNSSVSGGGAGKALVYLLRALQKQQVQTCVILPKDGVIGQAIRDTETAIHYVHDLPERFGKTEIEVVSKIKWVGLQRAINILLMPYFAWKISRIARREKVDLICSNHQILVPICVMAGYFSFKPTAIYCREYPEGGVAKLFFREIAKLDVVRKIFCVSKVSGELYQGINKAQVLYDSYDFEDFGRQPPEPRFKQQYNIEKNKFIFGFMGRIVERKGVDLLIRAFAQVHQKFPDTHLAIVGGNDRGLSYDLIGEYKKLAQEIGVENSVTFTGFINDVREMMYDFDVCVMPSLNPEPFGLVYLEAVISKIPCIVPDNSGAAEAVVNGENGKLFKAKNVESLEQAMCDSYLQRENRDAMTEFAYTKVKALFDTREQSGHITSAFLEAAGSSFDQ